jgi:peptidyl-tRNA hydrolase
MTAVPTSSSCGAAAALPDDNDARLSFADDSATSAKEDQAPDPPPDSTTKKPGVAAETAAAAASSPSTKKIVQYIVLRRDLDWPEGAVAAQAAHASVAALVEALRAGHRDAHAYIDPTNLANMTKVVFGVDSAQELQRVRERWNDLFPTSALLLGSSKEAAAVTIPTTKTKTEPVVADGIIAPLTESTTSDGAGGILLLSPAATAAASPLPPNAETLHCWVEQPENIPTALATWPVERTNKISKAIKSMKLTYF